MKGLQLSKLYYEEIGKPMLEKEFPAYIERIAIGLAGHGSECFGFDDDVSLDHDYGPGFSIWITEEDDALFGFKLSRAYSKLPKEFMGFKVQNTSLNGSGNTGVHTIKEFYSFYTGSGTAPASYEQWIAIPDHYLAEAVNGEVFADPLGEFSAIREKIRNGMPEDVRLKKLGSAVFKMAQSGQYNYSRCLAHGEKAAAALALTEFAQNTAQAVFLLNRTYMPYYKWVFRAMKNLESFLDMADMLEELLSAPYNRQHNVDIIESIARSIAARVRAENLSDRTEDYLEGYAYCINNRIKDGNLRNSSIIL